MDRRSLGESRSLDREIAAGSWQDLPEGVKLGDLCYQAGRFADALEAYSSVLKPPSGPRLAPDLRARLEYRIAACHMARASYRLALDHLDLARKALPRHLDRVILAKIHALRGRILQEMGQYARALRYLAWAEKLLRDSGEHEDLAQTENRLGHVLLRLGRTAEARDAFLSALATYRRIEHRSGEANTLNNLAVLYKNACDFREAVRYLELARALCERIGFRQRLVTIHINLGIVTFKLGKWELCEEHLVTALAMARETGSKQWVAKSLLAHGNLQLRRRRWSEAEALYREARGLAEAESYARERLLADEFLGELALARGEIASAGAILEHVLEEARQLAPEGDLVHETLRRLAEVRHAEGRFIDAARLAGEAADAAARFGDRYEETLARRVGALSRARLGDEDVEDAIAPVLAALNDIGDAWQKGMTHLETGRELARRAAEAGDEEQLDRAAAQLQRAYGAFLDLDARSAAAEAALERAELEAAFGRIEEAAAFRTRASELIGTAAHPRLEARILALGSRLDDAFAARLATGGDLLLSLREVKDLFQGDSGSEAVLDRLTRLAVSRSRSSRGCVARIDERSRFDVAAAVGWTSVDAQRFLAAAGLDLDAAVRDNRPMWSAGGPRSGRPGEGGPVPPGVRGFVLLPFTLADGRPGFLYVDKTEQNGEGAYRQDDLQFLTILANLTALSVMERVNLRLARENEELRKRIAGEDAGRFVTAHGGLIESLRLLRKVADSPVSVLLLGETGTGKGLIAQLIHETSKRRDHPFVQVNCAALPEQLLESELFGHVKGAFTGATYNKIGLFQEAEGGTLFLDEVDKTTLAVQAKLLHVLDAHEVRPVGSVKPARVDTRVICATNADLRAKIASGEFLEDLYYRLNDFTVSVPPLRERREDIPLLLDHFMKKFTVQYGRPDVRLGRDVRQILLDHPWPGNVRELEKVVRRLVVLAEDGEPVGVELLPPDIRIDVPAHSGGATLRDELARTERRVLADALRVHGWNRSRVSRELKISYPALLKKIREYGLKEPSGRS